MPRLLTRLLLGASLMFAASGAALAGKDLVVGVPDNLTGLDPADLNDNLSQSAARLMFEGLYMLDENMKLQPQLAGSFEANEEATQFIFHLRKGVTFHDGTPFNAVAVKASFDRAGNPANHLKRQSLFVMIDHTDAVDDYTVKVVLKYPFGAFVNDIAHIGALIVSPKSVQDFGKEVTRHPSGTGPYEFVSWTADTLKMKKNEHYWKPGLPKIDTITYRSVPENGARIAMLQTGEAQFIYPVPPEMIKSLQNSPTITVFDEPSILVRYIALNNLRKPFDDPRVRLALNYAVDKQAFIKVVFSGHADPMDSPMPQLLGFYQKQGSYPYDPAKAKALLAEAGYPNGFETTLTGASNTLAQRGMQFIQQQLAAVGVTAKVEPLEAGVLTDKMFNVQKPEDASIVMLYGGWSSSTGDADWGMRPMLYTKAFPPVLANLAWYSNKMTDAAIEEGLSTTDPTKRAAAYAKAQAQVWKDVPWIFLSVDHDLAAYSKKLTGASMRPDQQFHLTADATLN
ncbi:MAG TPA: glutathione ABC transporter substrate-binding protein [Acetobacteraceae bacterium]|nr:glutathione ABC transporter substrate-binding protein [Acetobacteraceae bacterium]